jgi:O-Antigen ligase
LITLDDAKLRFEPPVWRVQVPAAAPLADRIMHVLLYVCILSSFFVFVQPAPYEYLAVLLGISCVITGVTVSPLIIPLLILLLIRDASGAISLVQILGNHDSERFIATSFYLGLTGVIFACMFAQDTERRLVTLRSAYIMSAVLGSLFGTLGFFDLYFKFLPGLEIFSLNDRAVAGFKDPNVLGCFLLPPLMWLIEGFIMDKIKPHTLIASIVIFIGLLLAFSRAAWGSFVLCIVLMMYLLFITQKDWRVRKRVIFFMAGGAAAVVVIAVMLISIDVVGHMFLQRATLLQAYDSGGAGTRFVLQENSLREMLDHPLGMGPWGFAKVYGWVSHNTFLGSMLNYGWVGGIAYLTLIALSLVVGFRALWVRTPWQTFLIATYPTYVALVLEGFVVDTDHWRHFYLLLGLVWGLAAATQKVVWQRLPRPANSEQVVNAHMQPLRQNSGKRA